MSAAVSTGAGRWAGGQPCTLNSLIAAWGDVVAEVEDGYSWCAPELDNDLWCRDALARVWPHLPPRVAALRLPELAELDRRFRAATTSWPGEGDENQRWWHRRVPRTLAAEAGGQRLRGWPSGWGMLPFPKPGCVRVVE
ncbi:hypothetical protein ACFY8W_23905 [Streptomyces sp. NPDC012637]|uniref:hypothetical protein n=1 Tax=Streptomyces sp. NPDC012637 TaxID=3364842 RepID=UPI0036EB61A8